MTSSFSANIGHQEQERLKRAAGFLCDHLTESFNLDELARMAGFSKFHFHRLFKEQYGESPGDYVKRLRLEQAALRLLDGRCLSITDIAYQYGFASSQHFTNSFKKHFGVPPVMVRDGFDWRKILLKKIETMQSDYGRKHCLPVNVKKEGAFIRLPQYPVESLDGTACQELEVVTYPSYRVAYVRLTTRFLSEALGQAMKKMVNWSIAEKLFIMGAGQLMTANEIVPDEEGKYTVDVCTTISENAVINEDPEIKIRNLPGGLYGVYHGRFRTFEEFGATREKLMRGWWISSYYSRDRRPRYVIFYNGPTLDPSSVWLADICFPITTLQK